MILCSTSQLVIALVCVLRIERRERWRGKGPAARNYYDAVEHVSGSVLLTPIHSIGLSDKRGSFQKNSNVESFYWNDLSLRSEEGLLETDLIS